MAKKEKELILCVKHGKELTTANFYVANSNSLFSAIGRIPVCKSCISKLFSEYLRTYKDGRIAIYNMCRKLDIAFSNNNYEGASKEADGDFEKLFGLYMKNHNSLGKQNGVGLSFDDGEHLESNHSVKVEEFSDEIDLDDFEVDRNIIAFFGRGFEKEDYFVLMSEYEDWVTRYECDSKAMEDIIKQICLTNLDIQKRRMNGEKVDPQLKTLQDLLGSANLKPVQETGANATDQATFGTLIKKWENEHPIPDPLPEWKEKDVFQYVKVWFLGHLSKMIGLNNPYNDEYEEELIKHSVETPYFEDGDDSGE